METVRDTLYYVPRRFYEEKFGEKYNNKFTEDRSKVIEFFKNLGEHLRVDSFRYNEEKDYYKNIKKVQLVGGDKSKVVSFINNSLQEKEIIIDNKTYTLENSDYTNDLLDQWYSDIGHYLIMYSLLNIKNEGTIESIVNTFNKTRNFGNFLMFMILNYEEHVLLETDCNRLTGKCTLIAREIRKPVTAPFMLEINKFSDIKHDDKEKFGTVLPHFVNDITKRYKKSITKLLAEDLELGNNYSNDLSFIEQYDMDDLFLVLIFDFNKTKIYIYVDFVEKCIVASKFNYFRVLKDIGSFEEILPKTTGYLNLLFGGHMKLLRTKDIYGKYTSDYGIYEDYDIPDIKSDNSNNNARKSMGIIEANNSINNNSNNNNNNNSNNNNSNNNNSNNNRNNNRKSNFSKFNHRKIQGIQSFVSGTSQIPELVDTIINNKELTQTLIDDTNEARNTKYNLEGKKLSFKEELIIEEKLYQSYCFYLDNGECIEYDIVFDFDKEKILINQRGNYMYESSKLLNKLLGGNSSNNKKKNNSRNNDNNNNNSNKNNSNKNNNNNISLSDKNRKKYLPVINKIKEDLESNESPLLKKIIEETLQIVNEKYKPCENMEDYHKLLHVYSPKSLEKIIPESKFVFIEDEDRDEEIYQYFHFIWYGESLFHYTLYYNFEKARAYSNLVFDFDLEESSKLLNEMIGWTPENSEKKKYNSKKIIRDSSKPKSTKNVIDTGKKKRSKRSIK